MGSFHGFASPEELEELSEFRQRFAMARQLRALRARAGMTQQELAAKTGVAQPDISRMESGDSNPTLETLQRVARVFPGVSVAFVEEGHVVGYAVDACSGHGGTRGQRGSVTT